MRVEFWIKRYFCNESNIEDDTNDGDKKGNFGDSVTFTIPSSIIHSIIHWRNTRETRAAIKDSYLM